MKESGIFRNIFTPAVCPSRSAPWTLVVELQRPTQG